MKVCELIKRLNDLSAKNKDFLEYEIDLLTETDEGQVEQPLGDVAHSKTRIKLLPKGFS